MNDDGLDAARGCLHGLLAVAVAWVVIGAVIAIAVLAAQR